MYIYIYTSSWGLVGNLELASTTFRVLWALREDSMMIMMMMMVVVVMMIAFLDICRFESSATPVYIMGILFIQDCGIFLWEIAKHIQA